MLIKNIIKEMKDNKQRMIELSEHTKDKKIWFMFETKVDRAHEFDKIVYTQVYSRVYERINTLL